jgi:hypothetical protein
MRNLLHKIERFAETEFGDNLLLTVIVLGAGFVAYKIFWILYFMGVLQ